MSDTTLAPAAAATEESMRFEATGKDVEIGDEIRLEDLL